MDKRILIGGGIAAAVLVGFVVVKSRSNSAQAAQEAEASMVPELMPDTGYFSSMSPISGGNAGMSSDPGIGGLSVAGNSGSGDSGGGFDLAAVLSGMFSSQAEVNKLGVITNGHNYDSAVLASIVGTDGVATVSHSSTGTTISNTPNADSYTKIINDIYQTQLKRAPDTGGLAFYKNALMNGNVSISGIVNDIKGSAEAKAVNTPKAPIGSTYKTSEVSDGVVKTVTSSGKSA